MPDENQDRRKRWKFFVAVAALAVMFVAGGSFIWNHSIKQRVLFDGRSIYLAVGQAVSVKNKAEVKHRSRFQYETLRENDPLFDGDIVRTYSSSEVTLLYQSGNKLVTEGDSLLVVGESKRSVDPDRNVGVTTDRAALESGSVEGELARSLHDEVVLELKTPGAVARMRSHDQGDQVGRLRISIDRQSNKAEIVVQSGVAEVRGSGEGGEPVRLSQSQKIATGPQGKLMEPVSLLSAPFVVSPADNFTYRVNEANASLLRFQWRGVDGSDLSYEFQISASRGFEKVVFSNQIRETDITLNYLDSGEFFWRVRAIGVGAEGAVGEWSVARRLTVKSQ